MTPVRRATTATTPKLPTRKDSANTPSKPAGTPTTTSTASGWGPVGSKVSTDPTLKSTVAQFERDGGKGQWFASTDPFSGSPAKQGYYLITSMPAKADPKASLLVLREETTKQLLDGIVKNGTPVVLGTLPPAEEIGAAALGKEVRLSGDALAKGGITNHSSVLLLQPTASKFVVAHEYQHWKDFEDPALEKNFTQDMSKFLKASYLSADDKTTIWRLMWELRGHGAQAAQAQADAKSKVPFVDEAGHIITGPPKTLADDYAYQASNAANIFSQSYESRIFDLLNKIKKNDPSGVKEFAAVMAKYDFSKDRQNPVSFQKFADAVSR